MKFKNIPKIQEMMAIHSKCLFYLVLNKLSKRRANSPYNATVQEGSRAGTNSTSELVTAQIATAKCGVGNCGELNYLTMAKLFQKNYPGNIFVCVAESDESIFSKNHNHGFTIISPFDFTVTTSKITLLNSLSDDFILIDPLLKIVCLANKALSHPEFSKYLDMYHINLVLDITQYNIAQKPIFDKIIVNASKISNQIKKELKIEASVTSFSLFKGTAKESESMAAELNRTTGGAEILFSP